MYQSALFTGLLALLSASPAAAHGYVRCGNPEPSEEFRLRSSALATEARAGALPAINVPTYAHVVTTTARQGDFPLAQIKKQITVMNNRYKGTGVKFTLKGTDFTTNNAWASSAPGDSNNVAMKNSLHKGTYKTLNLYFMSDLGGNLLGFCPFPYSDIMPNNASQPYIKYDGCLILADSLPGGSAAPYDLGITAVHEVGHWFGTYHVFQGDSCTGDGDFVADTPPQKTATYGCPASKNTCSGGGPDSIHNYMDYSDDNCLNQFTTQQKGRINAVYSQFRACDGVCS